MFIKFFYKLFIIGLSLFAMSCGSDRPVKMQPEDSDIKWSAEANAILLNFQASKDLNEDRGKPSSLSVCIYQLSDSRVFEQLRKQGQTGLDALAACDKSGETEICQDKTGLAALAACKKFGDTVLAFNRIFLEPGQKQEVFFDRREGAKFIGLAAGYYNLESDRCIRLYPVPIIEVNDGWFSSHREPGQLVIELNFGPNWPEAPPIP